MDDKESRIEIGRRLRSAREEAGFATATEAARTLRLHKQNVQDHEAGRRGITVAQLDFYAKKYNVNFEWLGTGRGPVREEASVIDFWTKRLEKDDLQELVEIAKLKAQRSQNRE